MECISAENDLATPHNCGHQGKKLIFVGVTCVKVTAMLWLMRTISVPPRQHTVHTQTHVQTCTNPASTTAQWKS